MTATAQPGGVPQPPLGPKPKIQGCAHWAQPFFTTLS